MMFIGDTLNFPDVSGINDDIIAVGLRLDDTILKEAYRIGVFPWFNDDEPVLWWCPQERMVIELESFQFSKRLQQFYKKQSWTVTFNTQFTTVISECKTIERPNQEGTWITQDIVTAYIRLFEQGLAKSVEVWDKDELIGGLYGVDIGNRIFCGESMFSKVSGASKFAFIALVNYLQQNHYLLLDCQLHNSYLEQLGASIISKNNFLSYINQI